MIQFSPCFYIQMASFSLILDIFYCLLYPVTENLVKYPPPPPGFHDTSYVFFPTKIDLRLILNSNYDYDDINPRTPPVCLKCVHLYLPTTPPPRKQANVCKMLKSYGCPLRGEGDIVLENDVCVCVCVCVCVQKSELIYF